MISVRPVAEKFLIYEIYTFVVERHSQIQGILQKIIKVIPFEEFIVNSSNYARYCAKEETSPMS